MTITLTKAELEKFQNDPGRWYDERSLYLIQKFNPSRDRFRHDEPYGYQGNMSELIAKFHAEYPMPDWRTLL